MQTFLPYTNFQKTAQILDYRRLGKQRVEAKQILQILLNETQTKGWRHHPAVLMWSGYEGALANYGKTICEEWIRRGYKDSLLPYFTNRTSIHVIYPVFLKNSHFIRSHRSNLVRKDTMYYRKYFKTVPDNLPYIWPV